MGSAVSASKRNKNIHIYVRIFKVSGWLVVYKHVYMYVYMQYTQFTSRFKFFPRPITPGDDKIAAFIVGTKTAAQSPSNVALLANRTACYLIIILKILYL